MATSKTAAALPTRNVQIANTIRDQIGRALTMINGTNLIAVENGLRFKVECRGTRANYITITLDEGTDTYDFHAQKITGGRLSKKTWTVSPTKERTVLRCAQVYCDQLANLIADATGLCVSL